MIEIINGNGSFPCLIVCDHASAHIPPALSGLGLAPGCDTLHIALDLGIEPVVRMLAAALDAPAVLTGQSRLVLDTNRWIADSQSIPESSDGVLIPGNIGLSETDRMDRQERYFWPFHGAVAEQWAALRARHANPGFFALHSCTRQLALGSMRTMDGGTIWHEDSGFARMLAQSLSDQFGLTIADNAPYSGIGGGSFTLDYHCWSSGKPACGFEIVNDLIAEVAGQRQWAGYLAAGLRAALQETGPS